jgi:hypothetical protein
MSLKWTKHQINFVTKCYNKGHGRKSIAKLFRDKYNINRSVDSIKHCIDNHCIDLEVQKPLPKVLYIDIETAPLKVWSWGINDQFVSLDNIIQDWFILSFSAKWAGSDEIIYADQRKKKGESLTNDKELVKKIWKLMDQADIVVGQNLDKFDIPKIKARFIEHDLEDPSVYDTIDTVKIARREFGFTSNKLAYLTKKFCKKYKKLDHAKFAGIKLWDACMKGNQDAFKEMEKYNKYDVLSLEELFVRIGKYSKKEKVKQALRHYEEKK